MSSIWTPGGEYRPAGEEEKRGEQPLQPELTAEELAAEIRKLKISDVLLSTM
jgi:hypothetical protein